MNYYFAASFGQNPLMREYRDRLEKEISEAKVTSRWIDLHNGAQKDTHLQDELNDNPERWWPFGHSDLEDIDKSDTIVSFTDGGTGRGGRHVEYGYAIARNLRLVLVGKRESIFHAHPRLEVFDTFDEFLRWEKWRTP